MAEPEQARLDVLPPIDERRIALVANGILLLMRAQGEAPPELSDEDKQDLRLLAKGVIRIWDGLNVR